jgi:hypothetical protein
MGDACIPGALQHRLAVLVEFIEIQVTVSVGQHNMTKIVKIITYTCLRITMALERIVPST